MVSSISSSICATAFGAFGVDCRVVKKCVSNGCSALLAAMAVVTGVVAAAAAADAVVAAVFSGGGPKGRAHLLLSSGNHRK